VCDSLSYNSNMRSIKQQIFLASKSPRRAEILTQMGISFDTICISVPETLAENELCDNYVFRLAQDKAQAGVDSRSEEDLLVIGADTVIFFNDQILEKPKNEQDAFNMLTSLSNNTHLVKTAVSVCNRNQCRTVVQTSRVTMANISSSEISDYWQTGEPCDKAGGYAVQGQGAVFIKHIEGSYSGIMGLPIYETARLLNKFELRPE